MFAYESQDPIIILVDNICQRDLNLKMNLTIDYFVSHRVYMVFPVILKKSVQLKNNSTLEKGMEKI